MKCRLLRFNLHHLALVAVILLGVGMLLAEWPLAPTGVAALALILLVTDGIARPTSSLFYPTVNHGSRAGNCVALSFDDGPDPQVTPQVLDLLRANNARATFFVVGRALTAQPELAQRMVAEGHVLGNHSWQHARTQNFRQRRWQSAEIERCEQALDAVAGTQRARLYRAPMGLKIGALGQALWQRRLTLVAWSLHSHDTRLTQPEHIAQRVLERVRGGDIILLHDGHDLPDRQRPCCAAALTLILQGLHDKGLRCVTIPELLARDASRQPEPQAGQAAGEAQESPTE